MTNPITWTEYKKKPERFWKGRKVKTLRELSNGYWSIPEGFILTITHKYCGFDLKATDTCPHCGVGKKLTISRVNPTAVELCED